MKIKQLILKILVVLFVMLISDRIYSSCISNKNVFYTYTKSSIDINYKLKSNSILVTDPVDTMSFVYLLYLHSTHKKLGRSLVMKYLLPDLPEDNPDDGTYHLVDIEEIYQIDRMYIIIFTDYEDNYGYQANNTYIATFTENGEKIDEKTFVSLTITEWNSIETKFEFDTENIITRTSIDKTYSPENGGNTVSNTSETIERFKINPDGTITAY